MKAHAVEAIERAFSDQDDSAVMEELSPAIDAWEQVQAGFVAIAAGIGQLQGAFTTIAQDQQAMKARLAALEGTSQAGDMACLLPDHVAHLYVLARAIRAKTGLPIADTLALLARQFGVSEATDIPAVRWPDVLLALELHLKSEGA